MARSTFKTFLMVGTDTAQIVYEKLIDVKDMPDLGSAPESLDKTSLSDPMRTYIPGIQGSDGGLNFTCNYDGYEYQRLKTFENQLKHYAVWLGGTMSGNTVVPDGSEGKFAFDGYLSVYVTGAGVNEVTEMTVSITPTTAIEFDID